jgi:hypothetical protein
MQECCSMTKEAQEQLAYVMTLESHARVGSYQHEVSSGPWMILAVERAELARLSTDTLNLENARG